jgi:hypothetical protein
MNTPDNSSLPQTLKLTFGRGVVVITIRTGLGFPASSENGIHIQVFPFGVDCGVTISHVLSSKAAILDSCIAMHGEPVDPAAEATVILDQVARGYLKAAEVRCADFNPEADELESTRRHFEPSGAMPDVAVSEAMLESAMVEFERLLPWQDRVSDPATATASSESLIEPGRNEMYDAWMAKQARQARKMQKAKEKHDRKRGEHLRQKGEMKLIKNIARFKAVGKDPHYRHYLWLRVVREDVYANMDDLAVLRRSKPAFVIEVRRWLSDPNDIANALRWILRGLSARMAIRKAIADAQERSLAAADAGPLQPIAPYRGMFSGGRAGRRLAPNVDLSGPAPPD